jgi:hypothetical protein
MNQSKQKIITKIHLVISILIVIPVSLLYGFYPDLQFDIHLNTTDEHNFFKAIMGLYISFSILWILGIFKSQYLKTALITNMIFMLGLGFGRILSFFVDGNPTFGYKFGTFAEFFLGFYGYWVLSQKNITYNK